MNGSPVRLHRDENWDTVPAELQRRVEAGAERIRVLRETIAADAKVKYMPPVSVVAAGWSGDGQHVIHGVAGAWRDNNSLGGFCIGVLLSAGPALCEDEATVRAVLAHEFAHCFKIATIVVDHNELGASLELLRGDPMDPKREHLLLANPEDWFGPADIALLQWGDKRMQPATEEVHGLVKRGHLPGTQPPLIEPASFNVPDEWREHIRSLRATKR